MVFPEGLKTVRWDREGRIILEPDISLQAFMRQRTKDEQFIGFLGVERSLIDECDRVTIDSMPDKLTPLCLEEWQEEHYNVMA